MRAVKYGGGKPKRRPPREIEQHHVAMWSGVSLCPRCREMLPEGWDYIYCPKYRPIIQAYVKAK